MKTPFNSMIAALLLLAAGAPAHLAAATNEPPPSVRSLESLVSEWVRLRSQITAEARDLQDKKVQWTEEIKLLETEQVELEKELAEADAFVTSAEQRLSDLVENTRRMEQALDGIEPALDRAEAQLRPWKTRIPLSLRTELMPLFARLEPAGSGGGDKGVAERLQVVIALYTQIENLQHGIHAVREMLSIGETSRELDVLYIGLAGGFGVSPDNRAAAVGVLSDDGWTWIPRDDLAAAIREAIRVFNREAPARFVDLPLSVKDEQDAGQK